MSLSPILLLLLGCGREGDTGSYAPSNATQYNQSTNQQAAARWRGLKLDNTSFTGFGLLPGGGLRANVGTFVAELPDDGALHLKHRYHDQEIIVELESWGREGELNSRPISIGWMIFFKAAQIGDLGVAIKHRCLTKPWIS